MWFLIALIAGILVGALIFWMRNRDISLTWYEWLIGAMGLLLLMFTIQNFFGSFEEGESTAANMFLLITGLPSFILLVLTWQLAARRQKAG